MNTIFPILTNSLEDLSGETTLQRQPDPTVFLIPRWLPIEFDTGIRFLSSEERAVMARFQTEQRQRQYFLGRLCLRHILSSALHVPPATLNIERGEFGKPMLKPHRGNRSVFFNISHSRDYTAIAISHTDEIGIDIEFMETAIDVTQVAAIIMSEREFVAWRQLNDPSQQYSHFYDQWTRYEAHLKLTGLGFNSRQPVTHRTPEFAKLELPNEYCGAVAAWPSSDQAYTDHILPVVH